jgi:hypothetical protein
MTKTLSTSELREWARQNGFAVADRGRLPAQIHAAWTEASRRPKARTRRRTAPEPAASSRVTRKATTGAAPAAGGQATDIVALQSQMAALTDRVRQLEKKLASTTVRSATTKKVTRRG